MVIQIRNNAFTGRNNRYRHCQCARHPDSWPTETSGGGRSCSFRSPCRPQGTLLAHDPEAIEVIAEVGVIFLLFTIGLEFSLARLKNIFRQVALGGLLQVSVTALVTSAVCLGLDLSLPEAIVYGFVFALSSTALVLRTLGERGELDAPHGRFIVGTLIFQDLCIVPMVLIVPLLSQGLTEPATWQAIGIALSKAALVVTLLFATSRKLVPILFRWVDSSRSNEVFILTVLCLCIGTAYLTSLTGLSLALGAFLGGMIVADTDFRHRAMGDILPLRDVFVSFFFVSLGMFFDFQLLAEKPLEVGLLLLAFIGGKGLLAILAASFIASLPGCLVGRRGACSVWGVRICHFTTGDPRGRCARFRDRSPAQCGHPQHVSHPLLVYKAPHFTAGERALDPLAKLLRARSAEELEDRTVGHNDHVVVIGYGLAGRLLTNSLSRLKIEAVALEMNSDNVELGREWVTRSTMRMPPVRRHSDMPMSKPAERLSS